MPEIPSDFPVQPLKPGEDGKDVVQCGTCGLRWDDAIATGWTPAPAGRCPFEYFHDDTEAQETKAPVTEMHVHILRITSPHGHQIHVGWTREDVLPDLRQYVADWWSDIMTDCTSWDGPRSGNHNSPTMPEDWDDAIKAYFEEAGKLGPDGDMFSIQQIPIQGKKP